MRIKLIKTHRHAGRDYPAGAEIDLPERKANWLIGLKRAEAMGKAKPTTTEETKR